MKSQCYYPYSYVCASNLGDTSQPAHHNVYLLYMIEKDF